MQNVHYFILVFGWVGGGMGGMFCCCWFFYITCSV